MESDNENMPITSIKQEDECTLSAFNKTETRNVTKLCFLDPIKKLKNSGTYDIGGSYTDDQRDFWFYCSTSFCTGDSYLLNLFVRNRRAINFRIGISKQTESKMSNELEWYIFKTAKAEEDNYIKTFRFSKNDLNFFEMFGFEINMKIQLVSDNFVDQNILRRIKLNHRICEILSKQGKRDFLLESASGKCYDVHRIIVAALIPQCKEVLSNLKTTKMFLDLNDDEMELLLEFLYTGVVKDVWKQDCDKLLKLATTFQFNNLLNILQSVIKVKINVENAIDLALISEKYQLQEVQRTVFLFITKFPAVFNSEGWRNLDNVSVAKKICEYFKNIRTDSNTAGFLMD